MCWMIGVLSHWTVYYWLQMWLTVSVNGCRCVYLWVWLAQGVSICECNWLQVCLPVSVIGCRCLPVSVIACRCVYLRVLLAAGVCTCECVGCRCAYLWLIGCRHVHLGMCWPQMWLTVTGWLQMCLVIYVWRDVLVTDDVCVCCLSVCMFVRICS